MDTHRLAGGPDRNQPQPAVFNGIMVCPACRDQHHAACPGGTWCDCQHLPPPVAQEPPLAWIRQG
jgi:hypothetical protein